VRSNCLPTGCASIDRLTLGRVVRDRRQPKRGADEQSPGVRAARSATYTSAMLAMPACRRGVTLIEMLVVIILIALAAGLAIPALRAGAQAPPSLAGLIPAARDAAARRGETVRLRVGETGDWRLTGDGSGDSIAAGRVAPFAGVPLTLVVGPLGTCQLEPEAGSRPDRPAPALDPLTCEARSPPTRQPETTSP
jgi:prepilin-type N-terminal cleavage/methylation domain-containing protein